MTRRWIAACGLALSIAIVVVLIVAARHAPSGAAAPEAHAVPDVPLARVARAPFVVRVHAQGRVGAPSGGETRVSFAAAGIVARLDVHLGQRVRSGDALAELDTSGMALDVAQARDDAVAASASYSGGKVPAGALASAQARLAAARDRVRTIAAGTSSAQSDRTAALAADRQSTAKLAADGHALERATQLYAGGVAARKDVEAARAQLVIDRADADANRARAASADASVSATLAQARADLRQAQSDVATARAQLLVSAAQTGAADARYAAARRALDRATLRAPADGVIRAILKRPGEAVDPTQPAIVVGSTTDGVSTLTVGGEDAGSIRIGDHVALVLPNRERRADGYVREIVPGVDPTTQTTTIVVTGVPPGAALGDAIDATIDVEHRYGIVIPTSAIVEDPQSGKSIVFVRTTGKDEHTSFVARDVTIAAGDGMQSLVSSGLRPDERVARQGAFDLLAASGGG